MVNFWSIDDEGTPIHEPPQFGLTKLTAYDTLVSKHNPATGNNQ